MRSFLSVNGAQPLRPLRQLPARSRDVLSASFRLDPGGFVNRHWKIAAERMIAAMIKGKTIGMDEGTELMRQSRAENQLTMDDVRRRWNEVIREVKTVDNPLSPGDKIERSIYFDHSLILSVAVKRPQS